MSNLVLSFLGSPLIHIDGTPSHFNRRKPIALLAYLAITRDYHQREAIASLLWPDHNQSQAAANLRRNLTPLRHAIGADWVQTDGGQIWLKPGFLVDTYTFSQAVTTGQTLLIQDREAGLRQLAEAVSLYRGDFLTGFTLRDAPGFDEWQLYQIDHFRWQFVMALRQLIQEYSQQEQWSQAIIYGQKWVSLDPLHDPAQYQLIRLLAQSGQNTAASHQYEQYAQHLARELGTTPQPETKSLYEKIKRTQQPILTPLHPQHQLPKPSYTQLFGLDEIRDKIVTRLQSDQAPWIVTLVGIGGIGKTALAHAITQQVIQSGVFERVIWLQVGDQPEQRVEMLWTTLAQQLWPAAAEERMPDGESSEQRLARVRQVLKTAPHLIVIDNLETVTDTHALLAYLVDLADPTQFLVTTRALPDGQSAVFTQALPELSLNHATALLHHQLETTGLSLSLTETDIAAIYAVTGGNPLALKLIVSLMTERPLAHILHQLRQKQPPDLYQHIYHQAWTALKPTARTLLTVIGAVAPSGVTPLHWQAVSQIPDAQFWPAVSDLVSRSLVLLQGDAYSRRYALHPLTMTFLQAETRADLVTYVAANVAYWQQQTAHLAQPQTAVLEPERQNLYRAVEMGLAYPALWSETAVLALQIYPLIEQQGYWSEWIPLLQQVTQACPPEELAVKGRLLGQLGIFYRLNRQLDAALTTHQAEEEIGLTHQDENRLAHACLNLSEDYRCIRQYDQAEQYGLKALDTFTRLGAEAEKIAFTLNGLGLIAHALGRFDVAEQRLTRAVTFWRQQNQPIHLARALKNLAITLEAGGKVAQARQAYHEAAKLLAPTQNELDKAMIQISLGTLYFNQKEWIPAEAAFRQANGPFLQQSGLIYYQAMVTNNLGCVLMAQDKLGESENFLQQSVEMWRQIDGVLMLANTLDALADNWVAQGRGQAALPFYDEAMALVAQHPQDPWAKRLTQKIQASRNQLTDT